MSDDSLFREVDEDVRREQFNKLWQRYGTLVIAVCFGVILAVAGLKGWEYWQRQQAEQAGAAYNAALRLDEEDKTEAADKAFAELASGSHAGAAMLARFKIAGLKVSKGDTKGALADYDALAANGELAKPLRDLARIRAAYLAVDSASLEDIRQRVGPLLAAESPWRHSSRELVVLSAYRNGDYETADRTANEILADLQTPPGLRQRARAMEDVLTPLIAGKATTGN